MPDSGGTDSARLVATKLAKLALSGPAFDHDAITADYELRIEMDAALDELIGAGDASVRPVFDPRDPR